MHGSSKMRSVLIHIRDDKSARALESARDIQVSRSISAEDRLDQSRLAAAVAPAQEHALALRYLEVQIVYHFDFRPLIRD